MGFSREARIITLLVIDTTFFFIEIIGGYAVGSIALIADSFHMLNDIISLVVALYAIKLATTSSSAKYSYGWQRAEILGALANGILLLALCLSIFIECIQRLIQVTEVTNPMIVIIVGSLGLASNIAGLFLFHEHGHGGGHSHSHSKPSPPPLPQLPEIEGPDSIESLYRHPAQSRAAVVAAAEHMGYGATAPIKHHDHSHGPDEREPLLAQNDHTDHAHSHSDSTSGNADEQDKSSKSHGHGHGGSMNMEGVFLHVLGDALGNVGVIASGLIIMLCKGQWRFYSDPAISFLITCIIASSAIPLVKSASFILLQATPSTVSLDDLRDSILAVSGVISVHELHCWQLSEAKIVASVHVLVDRENEYMATVDSIRRVLHNYGIHSSTIQPEFPTLTPTTNNLALPPSSDQAIGDDCLLRCPPEGDCAPAQCCPPLSLTREGSVASFRGDGDIV
ncbi:Zn2 transporter ZNT1 and related Cd2 /Zn2 transporters (cation diffusion facilitator superfamily) [Phaffia rhodozyma]|uniref:Zn2 transporter ZNT1 and related Cd2 /Zn2 transporters (Cation diffusion facilitator superfamily) n=1 Tax=Phaffia rhodozyma TaxID=264483 RepID=A0A0F7SQE3_PHARH|nr:Zn2 transporter ZNT1 and related Cd2 /Zn2 transporters (cation diffusion facilitator superfamily) [Phaffia rhodozyma]